MIFHKLRRIRQASRHYPSMSAGHIFPRLADIAPRVRSWSMRPGVAGTAPLATPALREGVGSTLNK